MNLKILILYMSYLSYFFHFSLPFEKWYVLIILERSFNAELVWTCLGRRPQPPAAMYRAIGPIPSTRQHGFFLAQSII